MSTVLDKLCSFELENRLDEYNEAVIVPKWVEEQALVGRTILHERFWRVLIEQKVGLEDFDTFPRNTHVRSYAVFVNGVFDRRFTTDKLVADMQKLLLEPKNMFAMSVENKLPHIDASVVIIGAVLGYPREIMLNASVLPIHDTVLSEPLRQGMIDALQDLIKQVQTMKTYTRDTTRYKSLMARIHFLAPQITTSVLEILARNVPPLQLSDFNREHGTFHQITELKVSNATGRQLDSMNPLEPGDYFDLRSREIAAPTTRSAAQSSHGDKRPALQRATARAEYLRRLDFYNVVLNKFLTLVRGETPDIERFAQDQSILTYNPFGFFKTELIVRPHDFQVKQMNAMLYVMMTESKQESRVLANIEGAYWQHVDNVVGKLIKYYSDEYTTSQYADTYRKFVYLDAVRTQIANIHAMLFDDPLFKAASERGGTATLRGMIDNDVMRTFESLLPEPHLWNRKLKATADTVDALRARITQIHDFAKETKTMFLGTIGWVDREHMPLDEFVTPDAIRIEIVDIVPPEQEHWIVACQSTYMRLRQLTTSAEITHRRIIEESSLNGVTDKMRLTIFETAYDIARDPSRGLIMPFELAGKLSARAERLTRKKTMLLISSNTGTGKSTLAIMKGVAIAKYNTAIRATAENKFRLIYAAAASIGADTYGKISRMTSQQIKATFIPDTTHVQTTVIGRTGQAAIMESDVIICTHAVAYGIYNWMRRKKPNAASRMIIFIDEPTYDIGNYGIVVDFLKGVDRPRADDESANLAPSSIYSLMLMYVAPTFITYAGASIFSRKNMLGFLESLDKTAATDYMVITEQSGQIFMSTKCHVDNTEVALWDYFHPRHVDPLVALAKTPLAKRLITASSMLRSWKRRKNTVTWRDLALAPVFSMVPSSYDGSLIAEIGLYQRLNTVLVSNNGTNGTPTDADHLTQHATYGPMFDRAYAPHTWPMAKCKIGPHVLTLEMPPAQWPATNDELATYEMGRGAQLGSSIFDLFVKNADIDRSSHMIFVNDPIKMALVYAKLRGGTHQPREYVDYVRSTYTNAVMRLAELTARRRKAIAGVENAETATVRTETGGRNEAVQRVDMASARATAESLDAGEEVAIDKIFAFPFFVDISESPKLRDVFDVDRIGNRIKNPTLLYLLLRGIAVLSSTSSRGDLSAIVEYINRSKETDVNKYSRFMVFSDTIGAYGLNLPTLSRVYVTTSYMSLVSEETVGQALSRVGRRGISLRADAYVSNLTMLRLAANCSISTRKIEAYSGWRVMADAISASSSVQEASARFAITENDVFLINKFVLYISEYIRVEAKSDFELLPSEIAVHGDIPTGTSWATVQWFSRVMCERFTRTNELSVATLFGIPDLDRNVIMQRLNGTIESSVASLMTLKK